MMKQQTYGPLGDARYLSYVDGMKDSGERLLQFFASILELAELESGRKALKADAFSVDEMLVAVTRRFAGQAQRAGLSLSLGSACGARLIGDRFALERMTGNIVENAIRFTPAGGKVNVAAYAAADGVVLEITDTGIGMQAERITALSQPFAFGDAVLTRQQGGAGLGIAIARAIAELSGGRLAIDSRPALGTTVAISLPLPASQLNQIRAA
jgi:two-component system cell cycle sensor histidine kinase PleC